MLRTRSRKLLSTTLLFLLCCNTLYAQLDDVAGYVVKNNQDTVRGFIVMASELRNFTVCEFRSSPNGAITEYTPDDLLGYGNVEGMKYITMTPREGVPQKIFIRSIVSGPLSFYQLPEGYLIMKGDSSTFLPTPLKKKLYRNPNDFEYYEVTDKIYVGRLNYLLYDCKIKADKIHFGEKEIGQLIVRYNRCKGYEPDKRNLKTVLRLNGYAFTGAMVSNLQVEYQTKSNFTRSHRIPFGVGFDLSSPRVYDKLMLSVELWYESHMWQGYTEQSFSGSFQRTDIFIRGSYFKVPISVRYNFFRGTGSIPYVRLGYNLHFLRKASATYLQEREDNGVIRTDLENADYELRDPRGIAIGMGYDWRLKGKVKVFGELRLERNQGIIRSRFSSDSTITIAEILFGIRY